MNSIIKPWPFWDWAIDLINPIYPPSSKRHKFILVATDYFTKWVEAIPLKKVTSANMIDFVEHIVYRFGIPQTITTNQGTLFTSGEFDEFAIGMGIKVLNSSPYYAQANGQVEASNKRMKPCGRIGWRVMARPKYHLINWYMDMMQNCLGKLKLVLGECFLRIS